MLDVALSEILATKAYIFAQGLELVFHKVLAALYFFQPFVQLQPHTGALLLVIRLLLSVCLQVFTNLVPEIT